MDITSTLAPKSQQLNTDDLIAGPRTITITKVTAGNNEQPVAVHFQGDEGKPWFPCKSMRRVLVAAWGADASQYVGRGVTLFRDPEVQYGGIKVGGIRISHLSGLDGPLSIALTVTRQKRAPYRVEPLKAAPAPAASPSREEMVAAAQQACIEAGLTDAGIHAFVLLISNNESDTLEDLGPRLLAKIAAQGISPETVNRCNGADGAKPDDLPAAWS
jgi:hypothetical protein